MQFEALIWGLSNQCLVHQPLASNDLDGFPCPFEVACLAEIPTEGKLINYSQLTVDNIEEMIYTVFIVRYTEEQENMNAVTVRYEDKKMNMYGLDVNNIPVQAFRVVTGYNVKCNPVYGFQIQLAPDYNMSGKKIFSARTLKALVAKIEKHPDRLVK